MNIQLSVKKLYGKSGMVEMELAGTVGPDKLILYGVLVGVSVCKLNIIEHGGYDLITYICIYTYIHTTKSPYFFFFCYYVYVIYSNSSLSYI